MSAEFTFLADLTVALTAAVLAGAVATRLHVNSILGYLLAGIVIGPFTPGYVAHGETLNTLATLGLIFLLFSLGLGFSFHEIKTLGTLALIGNLVVMAAIVLLAAGGAQLFGFAHPLTIGLITAVSSTAVGAALLQVWKIENAVAGRFALAQLIVQDFVAVALLVVVTAPGSAFSPIGIAIPILKALGFTIVALLVGATVLASAVKRVLAKASTDTLFPVFTALAMVAAWLGNLAGLSFEFGAFVAGAVISEAAGSRMVMSVVAPFRALFVALFFVSVGMLIDPKAIAAEWRAVLIGGAVFVVLRFGLWGALARLRGLATGAAIAAALTMTALGEFNVVLVNEARAAQRIDSPEAQALLGIMLLSIVLSIAVAPLVPRLLESGTAPVATSGAIEAGEPLVAIIGFGRVGRTVGAVLRQTHIAFAALDISRDVVEQAKDAGFDIVVGDGADPIALEKIVRPSTRLIITTIPELAATLAMMPRLIGFAADIVARGGSGAEVTALRAAGAARAFVPEAEGALVFARTALSALGLDTAQIERELDAQREHSTALANVAVVRGDEALS